MQSRRGPRSSTRSQRAECGAPGPARTSIRARRRTQDRPRRRRTRPRRRRPRWRCPCGAPAPTVRVTPRRAVTASSHTGDAPSRRAGGVSFQQELVVVAQEVEKVRMLRGRREAYEAVEAIWAEPAQRWRGHSHRSRLSTTGPFPGLKRAKRGCRDRLETRSEVSREAVANGEISPFPADARRNGPGLGRGMSYRSSIAGRML
jgi:hypothetical protein